MKRGVSIMFINGLVVAVVLLFSFGVDVTNRLVHQRYDQTVASQRALIACNNASKVFQQQSDELTLRVNNYVETDSTDALFAYFAILDNQSREHEIEIAERYDVDCTTLKQALALSDALAEREIHTFALMVETESISSLLHVQNVFEIVEELVIICLALLLYRQVTVVLRKYIRSISRDEAITPGGDEFVIWMDGIQLGDVEAIKEKIQEVNHRTVLIANMTMQISVSVGVTFCRYGDAYKDALRRVDTALYEMKRTGKHGCAVYEEL